MIEYLPLKLQPQKLLVGSVNDHLAPHRGDTEETATGTERETSVKKLPNLQNGSYKVRVPMLLRPVVGVHTCHDYPR